MPLLDPDMEVITATARRVADVYSDSETYLIGKTRDAVKRGLSNADSTAVANQAGLLREEPLRQALLNEVTALKDDARKQALALDEWAKTALPNTVREGADIGSTAVGRSLAPLRPGMNISSRSAINTRAIEALSREVFIKSNRVHVNIVRNVEDSYRTVISDITGRVLTGAATREQAAQLALNSFAEQGISGFTDKAGRRWNIASYVEMATRSSVMRAYTEGTVERLKEQGLDYLRVSSHKNSAPECEPFQGQILSASGDNIGRVTEESELDGSPVMFRVVNSLEGAKARGFQHPGCRHTVSAYIPGTRQNTPQEPADPEGYKNTQELRRLEREVRKARREEAAALTPGEAARLKRKVAEGRKRIAEHVEATNVVRQPKRERISGVFGRGDSTKAPTPLPKRGSMLNPEGTATPAPVEKPDMGSWLDAEREFLASPIVSPSTQKVVQAARAALPKGEGGWSAVNSIATDKQGGLIPSTELLSHLDTVSSVGRTIRADVTARMDLDPQLAGLRAASVKAGSYKPSELGLLEYFEAQNAEAAAHRLVAQRESEYIRRAIAEIRELGGHQQVVSTFSAADLAKVSSHAGRTVVPADAKTVALFRQAEAYYPTDWLKAAAARGPVNLGAAERGFYLQKHPSTTSVDSLVISPGGAARGTAHADPVMEVMIHETGHRMEMAVPGLMPLEFALARSRATHNGVLEDLVEMHNSGSGEFAYEDDWLNAYTGRSYVPQGYTRPDLIASEVFQTGTQDLFGRSLTRFAKPGDNALDDFMLGVITTL